MKETYTVDSADANSPLAKYIKLEGNGVPLSHPDLPQGRQFICVEWTTTSSGLFFARFEVAIDFVEKDNAPFRCKFCGLGSWIDPSDQSAPPDVCHGSDHGQSNVL